MSTSVVSCAVRVIGGVLCRMRVFGQDVRCVSTLVVCDEFTPEWWKFVKGVIESKELPLDVPRVTPRTEILRMIVGDFCWLGCVSGWRTLPQREGANFSSRCVADLVDEYTVRQLKEFDGMGQDFVIEGLGGDVSSVNIDVAEEVSVTSELGVDSAQEIMGPISSSSISLVDFSGVFSLGVSMITVSSVETTSAGAVPNAFDVVGSDMSTSTISERPT